MTPQRMIRMLLVALMLVGAFTAGEHAFGSASAQARSKWEYQVVKIDRMDRTNAQGIFQVQGLSKLGEEGWEAVSINDSWCLLKRPK